MASRNTSGTLRAVKPGDSAPAPAKPKTLTEAIESGTYLEILEAQRRQIVVDLKDEKGPAKAAMHRQLALLSKEIEALRSIPNDDEEGGGGATPDEQWDPAEAL